MLASLMAVPQLLAEVESAGYSSARALVFSGTLATIGGFAYGARFEVELSDPVLHRELRCAYDIERA
jgi:hypothetical protein